MYQRNLIPTINKPTRVGKNPATAIDYIIAECSNLCLQNSNFKIINCNDPNEAYEQLTQFMIYISGRLVLD